MSGIAGVFASVSTELSPLTAFHVGENFLKYEDYLDSRRFASIHFDGQHCFEYDLRYGASRTTTVGTWIMRWAHWGGRGVALHIDSVVVPLDMPFIRCTEESPYLLRLAVIMVCHVNLQDEEFTTHVLNYVALLHPYDRHHLLTNFEYSLKLAVLERRLRLKSTDPRFVN